MSFEETMQQLKAAQQEIGALNKKVITCRKVNQNLEKELTRKSSELRSALRELLLLRNDEDYVINTHTGNYHRRDCKLYLDTCFSQHWEEESVTRADAECEGYRPGIDCVYPKHKSWIDWEVVRDILEKLDG